MGASAFCIEESGAEFVKFDVVLMDIMMRRSNGVDVLRDLTLTFPSASIASYNEERGVYLMPPCLHQCFSPSSLRLAAFAHHSLTTFRKHVVVSS